MGIPLYVERTPASTEDPSPIAETPGPIQNRQHDQSNRDDPQPLRPFRTSLPDINVHLENTDRRRIRRTAVEILAARTAMRNAANAIEPYNPRYLLPLSTRLPDRDLLANFRIPRDFVESGYTRDFDVDVDHDSDTETEQPTRRPRRRYRNSRLEIRSFLRRDENNQSNSEPEDWGTNIAILYRPNSLENHPRTFPARQLR
ncbi:hypothetical protein FPQ18DRAFT_306029 [Pyronema domesticum]|nr:hypothetical protein FPQ18DRAFT_306029 [Pyronema domesticum]